MADDIALSNNYRILKASPVSSGGFSHLADTINCPSSGSTAQPCWSGFRSESHGTVCDQPRSVNCCTGHRSGAGVLKKEQSVMLTDDSFVVWLPH